MYSLFLLTKVQEQSSQVSISTGRWIRSSALLVKAGSAVRRLLEADSDIVEWRQLEKQVLFDEAISAIARGEPGPGMEEVAKAVVALEDMKADVPNGKLITLIAEGHVTLALRQVQLGDAQSAREHFQQAIKG